MLIGLSSLFFLFFFLFFFFFFFNDTATTEIYTLSLHDALPIWASPRVSQFLRRSVAEALGREVEVALVSLGGKSSEAHHRRIALARDVLDVLRDATVSRRHRFEQEADRQVFEALGGIRRGANGGAEDGQ